MRSTASPASALLATLSFLAAAAPAGAVTVSSTYYEDGVQFDCFSSTLCQVPIPLPSSIAGKFLNLHYISCGVTTPGPLANSVIGIADAADPHLPVANYRRIQWLAATAAPRVNGLVEFRQQLEMKVAGGPPRHLIVSFQSTTSGGWTIGCSITGEISTQ